MNNSIFSGKERLDEVSIWVTLKGGARVTINIADKSECKKCGKKIFWAVTKNLKNMPVCQDQDGQWISHFVNCSHSKFFRGMKSEDTLDEIGRQKQREKGLTN